MTVIAPAISPDAIIACASASGTQRTSAVSSASGSPINSAPVARYRSRSKLGFTEVTGARQGRQYERYRRVFRNENNSTDLVISRRWTALQAPDGIVTTIRFRDPAVRLPYLPAGAYPFPAKDITVTGQVADADLGNLFPRVFRVLTGSYAYTVHLRWWKFASPVRVTSRHLHSPITEPATRGAPVLDRIALITGNVGKAVEYAAMLGIEVTPARAELSEIQSLDVADVAARKAADAYAQLGEPVLVDDTGLTVNAWNGLPGALVAWFLDTVGPQGILAMAAGLTDRRATVSTALGYATAGGVRVFQGTVNGSLATEPRGTFGFGYDSIFIPDSDTSQRTYAQMTSEEKSKISHRRRAVEEMRSALGLT